MITEIKGKANSRNTNLTELGEDELTGNFFGSMRYIPFIKGVKKILKIPKMNCWKMDGEMDLYMFLKFYYMIQMGILKQMSRDWK